MATQHVVVDGSNIATEGRSLPSLEQLEAAVDELHRELPEAEVTVVVDATFAHRIAPEERSRFEQAALRGEYVYPPAGAIGRGDAFLLRIAERVDGIVLSNDSFQEFHGEHEWLFERGRLLGATPVPGVGWIFVARSPVRGPRSRVALRDASRAKDRVVKAIEQATREVVDPVPEPAVDAAARRPRSRNPGVSPQAVNDPMTFISFIAEHPLGGEIEGTVESFTSHGAVVRFGAVRCYVPLSGLGNPPPRAAREVLARGESRTFIVTALDPFRRGVELALPGVAIISGHPSDETVAAEVKMARSVKRDETTTGAHDTEAAAPRRRGRPPKSAQSGAPIAPKGAAPSKPAASRAKVVAALSGKTATVSARQRGSADVGVAEVARSPRKATKAPQSAATVEPVAAPPARRIAKVKKAAPIVEPTKPAAPRSTARRATVVSAATPTEESAPVRRGPGRPRKVVAVDPPPTKSASTARKSPAKVVAPVASARARKAAAPAPDLPTKTAGAPRRSPAKLRAAAAAPVKRAR